METVKTYVKDLNQRLSALENKEISETLAVDECKSPSLNCQTPITYLKGSQQDNVQIDINGNTSIHKSNVAKGDTLAFVAIVGPTTSTASFQPYQTPVSFNGLLLTAYDVDKQYYQWSTTIQGAMSYTYPSVISDCKDNVYVMGYYTQGVTVTFNDTSSNSVSFVDNNSSGCFIAKYDRKGIFQWKVYMDNISVSQTFKNTISLMAIDNSLYVAIYTNPFSTSKYYNTTVTSFFTNSINKPNWSLLQINPSDASLTTYKNLFGIYAINQLVIENNYLYITGSFDNMQNMNLLSFTLTNSEVNMGDFFVLKCSNLALETIYYGKSSSFATEISYAKNLIAFSYNMSTTLSIYKGNLSSRSLIASGISFGETVVFNTNNNAYIKCTGKYPVITYYNSQYIMTTKGNSQHFLFDSSSTDTGTTGNYRIYVSYFDAAFTLKKVDYINQQENGLMCTFVISEKKYPLLFTNFYGGTTMTKNVDGINTLINGMSSNAVMLTKLKNINCMAVLDKGCCKVVKTIVAKNLVNSIPITIIFNNKVYKNGNINSSLTLTKEYENVTVVWDEEDKIWFVI